MADRDESQRQGSDARNSTAILTFVEQDANILQHEPADDVAKELAGPAQVALNLQANVPVEKVVRAVVLGRNRARKDRRQVLIYERKRSAVMCEGLTPAGNRKRTETRRLPEDFGDSIDVSSLRVEAVEGKLRHA